MSSNKKACLGILLVLFAGLAGSAKEGGKHLFVLSGQSNMARFNEKATFVPAVEAAFGAENVIVVKDAQGGQPILRWFKGWQGPVGRQGQQAGDLYDRLMEAVRLATVGEEIESVSFIWMQGEADAKLGNAAFYEASLKGLLGQFAADMGRTEVDFVLGRLSDFDMSNSRFQDWTRIRSILVEVAESSPRGAWVDTDDLNDGVNKKGEPVENDLHYTAAGYRAFGERLAAAAIRLIKERGDSDLSGSAPFSEQ